VPINSTLFLWLACTEGSNFTGVIDSKGNTWVLDVTAVGSPSWQQEETFLFRCNVTTALATTDTITATATNSLEYSYSLVKIATGPCTLGNNSGVATVTAGALTLSTSVTAVANQTLLAFVTNPAGTITQPAGWTALSAVTAAIPGVYYMVPAAGSQTFTLSWTTTYTMQLIVAAYTP
jgi:hypothetical protein